MCACVSRGRRCGAPALPGAPAGSASHEAAAGAGQAQGAGAAPEGQGAVQRALQAVPGPGHTPPLRPPGPSRRPRGVAGDGERRLRRFRLGSSDKTTCGGDGGGAGDGGGGGGGGIPCRDRVPRGVGEETFTLLPPGEPVCERGEQGGGETDSPRGALMMNDLDWGAEVKADAGQQGCSLSLSLSLSLCLSKIPKQAVGSIGLPPVGQTVMDCVVFFRVFTDVVYIRPGRTTVLGHFVALGIVTDKLYGVIACIWLGWRRFKDKRCCS